MTGDLPVEGESYDLVLAFEMLHDLARPVEALATMRRLAAPDGTVVFVDERTAETFTASCEDPTERLLYAASVLHCLPVGRAEGDSAATGTVMRPSVLEGYARAAGFDGSTCCRSTTTCSASTSSSQRRSHGVGRGGAAARAASIFSVVSRGTA